MAASLDQCLGDLEKILNAIPDIGPILRFGTIGSAGGTTAVVAGQTMPYVDVGVTPVAGRTAAYVRTGTSVVCLGMLAT